MAKKEAGALAQTRIPGTHDEIPKDLQEKVDELVRARRRKQKAAGEEAGLKDVVIELMEKHDIDRVPLDDGKDVVLKRDPKVDIKKRKSPPEATEFEGDEDDDSED